MSGPTPANVSTDYLRAAAIFLLVFTIYFVGYSRTLPPTADEMIDFGLAQSFAKWHTAAIDQVSTVGPNPEEFGADGHRYSKYGPLQAALSVPLFLLAQHLPIGETDTVLLLNHLVTAATAALLFLLVRRMGYGAPVALTIVAIVIFGTPLWVHSKRYFSEPTITLTVVGTILAAYLAATTGQRRWLALTGAAFSLAIAAKYFDALLLLPVPLYLAWEARIGDRPHPPAGGLSQRERRIGWERVSVRAALRTAEALLYFGVGAAPVIALLGWYDFARFGNALATGYAHQETFSTPVLVGVAGFLFSPGKSIFIYTPIFLLVPFWVARFFRRFPSFTIMLGAIVVLHLGLYGAWWVWWGAWAWGPRFIVPILPFVALTLAEGISTMQRPLVKAVVLALGVLSVAIQILGIAVDHTIYLVQLLPLNSRPDTLTLYDFRYSPILHQIPLLTRQWLDFAWIVRAGPTVVNLPSLAAVLLGVVVAVGSFVIVWRLAPRWSVPTLTIAAALIAVGTFVAMHGYDRQITPELASMTSALATAPSDTAVLEMIPSSVIPYANWQKRDLPELGWIEEPNPGAIISQRLSSFEQSYPSLWVITQTPEKAPSNGIEARLDRSLVEVGDEQVGGYRLLRYLTRPADLALVDRSWLFASGIGLAGYALRDGPAGPGRTVNLVLKWQASSAQVERPDYTVFVHLVSPDGALVAQHDDPPASGYASTSSWRPGQIVYDDHAITIPSTSPSDLHLFQVGLYLPSTGQRLPLVSAPDQTTGDTALLDIR